MADSGNNRVVKYNNNGVQQAQWGSTGTANSQFTTPYAIAVDGSNLVYVSDSTGRIQRFDSSGTYLGTWGSSGRADGQFLGIRGMDVDSSGNLFATELSNSRVQKLDSSGNYLLKWGIFGFDAGMFDTAAGVAVNGSGTIYVVDSGNDRVQVFVAPAAATFDVTGTLNFSWTNKRTTAQVTYTCVASPDTSGTMTFTQNGNLVSVSTSTGTSLSGFVSGAVYTISRASSDFADYTEEFVITFSSSSAGSGTSDQSVTNNAGSYCTGDGLISLSASSSGGSSGGAAAGAAEAALSKACGRRRCGCGKFIRAALGCRAGLKNTGLSL